MSAERQHQNAGQDGPRRTSPEPNDGLGALPGVARLAASAAWHTTGWSVDVTLRLTKRMLEVAVAPQKAGALVEDVRDAARAAANELRGESPAHPADRHGAESGDSSPSGAMPGADVARRVVEAVPGGETARRVVEAVPGGETARRVVETIAPQSVRPRHAHVIDGAGNGDTPLRLRGRELIYRSRDVHYEETAHPAYERLVESLAPDEARILRLLLFGGPQPAIDVRTGGPLGLVNSRLLAPGLNMIGARAGCRYVERVPSYLTNLHRLGLIWFSRETLRHPELYQVVEAQPDVLEALHSVRYAKIVRRSIHLTPFGEGFCRTALVDDKRQLVDLPEHGSPQSGREPQPPELTP